MVRLVTESKRIEAQVGKMLSFKTQVSKMKMVQTICRFTVISPFKYISLVSNLLVLYQNSSYH